MGGCDIRAFARAVRVVRHGDRARRAGAWTGPLGTFADLPAPPALRGRHNIQNALAASAAAMIWALRPIRWRRGLLSFPGLAHRPGADRHAGRTLFINDSKATNADSTVNALRRSRAASIGFWAASERRRHYLAEDLLSAYREGLPDRCGADEFKRTLDGAVPVEMSGTLDVAVASAARDAAASPAAQPVVLLSPACASYDQFKNFEVRGEAFRTLVAALPGVTLKR